MFNFKKNKKPILITAVATLVILAILCLLSALGPLRTFIPNITKITGTFFGSRTYLVLFQNNYELRPTGGFISAYGILEFKMGFPTGLSFYDVYGEIDDHEYIDPPHYPMYELLYSETYGGYTFRDANYYIDFRDSAQELIDFYQITNPDTEIDGIMTVDFSTLEDLIGLYEPIAGFTENSLFEGLETEASDIDRHNLEDLNSRKDIMKKIVRNLFVKAFASPFKLDNLFDTLAENLDEKHMLLWFADENLEEKVINLGWGGAMPEYEVDLLAVNESNLGGMKNDRYISRNIKYEVDIQEDKIVCELTIDIDHYGGENIPLSGDYKGYFRAYVPSSAELTSDGYEESYEDYKSFGDIVRLESTEGTTLTYKYKLPALTDDTYILDLIKQPGTDADHYEIIVNTPQGYTLTSKDFETKEEHAYFSDNLETDLTLTLQLNEDTTSPRIHSHEIVEMNKIWIGFNEDLDCGTVEDQFAYTIVDTDTTNDWTDVVTIDSITCRNGEIWLDTLGMTEQNEEFYTVTIRNIRDTSGNYLDPNTRTITVVQRYL